MIRVKSEGPSPADGPSSAMQRILKIAGDLFAEHGYDCVSMNTIAEHAGVSKANIFHHFKSKDDLYIKVLREACRESRNELDSLDLKKGDGRQGLKDYARNHLAAMLRNIKDSQLILREIVENDPERSRQLAEDVFHDGFVRLVEALREYQERGGFRKDLSPAHLAVFMLSANVFFTLTRDILRHFPEVDCADDPDRYSTMFMDTLLRGAAPEKK